MRVAPDNNSGVTVREVYGLIQGVESRLLSEIRALGSAWDARLEAHGNEHARDRNLASQRIRWAVTTIMTGAVALVSLLVSIYKQG